MDSETLFFLSFPLLKWFSDSYTHLYTLELGPRMFIINKSLWLRLRENEKWFFKNEQENINNQKEQAIVRVYRKV